MLSCLDINSCWRNSQKRHRLLIGIAYFCVTGVPFWVIEHTYVQTSNSFPKQLCQFTPPLAVYESPDANTQYCLYI